MECRCYRGGDGRTRLKVLKFQGRDWLALAVCLAAFGAVWATRYLAAAGDLAYEYPA